MPTLTPQDMISDTEIDAVHGNANFGSMSKREVVDEGVLKAAFGYSSGSTQLAILREHGLIRRLQPGSCHAKLTEKGMRYLRLTFAGKIDDILRLSVNNETQATETPDAVGDILSGKTVNFHFSATGAELKAALAAGK